jgi:hypothetical protein
VNDIVLSESEKTVSRRAARLHRSSQGLELEALDQRDALVVVRPNGERVRPVLSANGRVLIGPKTSSSSPTASSRCCASAGGGVARAGAHTRRTRSADFPHRLAALKAGLNPWKRHRKVAVDPFLVAKAIKTVMAECRDRTATGSPLVWNDYAVFLT